MIWRKTKLCASTRWTGWLVGLLISSLVGCQGTESAGTLPPPTATAILATETVQAVVSPTAVLPTATMEKVEMNDGADADVIDVRAILSDNGTWTFHVTVFHPDTGCEDYADGWDVVLPDGTVVKPDADSPFTRLLLHPHENEQPFTRSQSRIHIPADVTRVNVRVHDLVDGFGGQEVLVDLTAASGPGFRVEK